MSVDQNARAQFIATGRLPSGSKRLVELDALRGIAIALVVAFHYLSAHAVPDQNVWLAALGQTFTAGWAGVDLFFVLSGFLIGSILLENAGAANFFQAFYVRRAARLLPLYLLVYLVYLLAKPLLLAHPTAAGQWLVQGSNGSLPDWSYLLYVQNIFQGFSSNWGGHWMAPTWSLAVEEQFYLVAPLLIFLVPRERLAVWLGGLILASLLCRCALLLGTADWIPGYVLLPSRADALLIGMAGALAVSDARCRQWLAAQRDWFGVGLRVTGALLVAVTIANVNSHHWLMATAGHTVIAVLSLIVIFAALFSDGWFCRVVLRNQYLIGLGQISYAVYLLHQPMQGLVALAADGRWVNLADRHDLSIAFLACVATVCLARISAVWLERPLLSLGHRVQFNKAGRVPQAA